MQILNESWIFLSFQKQQEQQAKLLWEFFFLPGSAAYLLAGFCMRHFQIDLLKHHLIIQALLVWARDA